MKRLISCLVLFGCAWVVSSLDRTKRRCRDEFSNFTMCELFWTDDFGDETGFWELISGFDNAWNNNFYNGKSLYNATRMQVILNSSQPYYYLTMQIIWTDFSQNYSVDTDSSFLRYRNVRNHNSNEWIVANTSLEYYDDGSGIVARYGFNHSSDDSTNGALTDEIHFSILFNQQMDTCDFSSGDCRFTNIQLWSHTIPTYSPTSIPSNMPSFNPTSQPTFNPSTIPSKMPTFNPSAIPSRMPSFEPSAIPTGFPSIPPTGIPSNMPSVPPTRLPTKLPTVTDFDEDDIPFNFDQIETVGILFVGACIAVAVFLVCVLFIMHRFRSRKGNSTVKFIGLIKYIQSIADVWIDLIFALIVYLQRDLFTEDSFKNIYLFAFGFAAGPYVLSIIASIFWTCKWRRLNTKEDYPVRLNLFSEKFGCIMIMLTLLSNFYSVADLCHSKIFYSRFTNLPLKKNEYNVLKRWKLINIVILENIPQLVIQIIYILFLEPKYRSIIVFFSMGMTVISLFLGIRYQLHCCDEGQFVESRFNHAPKYKCKFTLESIDITMNHSYGNKKIAKAIEMALKNSEDSKLWENKTYVMHQLEVYWMNGRKGGMDIYFDCTLLYNARARGDKVAKTMFAHISNMMREGTPDHEHFKDALGRKLNLKSPAKITVSRFECLNAAEVEGTMKQPSRQVSSGAGVGTGSSSQVEMNRPTTY